MQEDSEGFLYPSVDRSTCINCGKCDKVCPIISNRTKNNDSLQEAYAAYAKDDNIRLASSSGGIFTLIAQQILNDGGVVIGAAMSEDQRSVHHVVVENMHDLELLRGSKYVQSTIGDTYARCKEYLDNGIKVMFTGTPCQIGGLYSYLNKDYDNLITQDLICHGVPSPLVWNKYVEYREKIAQESSPTSPKVTTRRTFFRVKPWKRFSVRFEFSNRTEYLADLRSDPYMRGFLNNIYLRPSCYDCKFKTVHRQADITLADFWGIQNVFPDMDDDKGCSVVWIHSDKGVEMWKNIEMDTVHRKVEAEVAIKYNSSAIRCVDSPAKREQFFTSLNDIDLITNIQICTKKPLIRRIKAFVGRCLRYGLKVIGIKR